MKKIRIALLTITVIFAFFVIFTVSVFASDLSISNLKCTAKTDTSITLEWNAEKGADGYKIYIVKEDGSLKSLKYVHSTSYTVKKLESGTVYKYAVRPYTLKEDGKSRDFGKISRNAVARTKLSTPLSLTLSKNTKSTLTVNWNAVDKATSYEVYFKQSGESDYRLHAVKKGTTTKIGNLKPGTGYKVKVLALNEKTKSSKTEPVTSYTVPEKVSGLSAKAESGKITVSWKKGTPSTIYALFVSEDGGKNYRLLKKSGNTSYVLSNPKFSHTYTFKVVTLIEKAGVKVKSTEKATVSVKTQGIKISGSTWARKGEYVKLSVPGVKNKEITWSTSNSSVVSITASNKLFANGQGSCTVYAKYGTGTDSVTVTIGAPPVTYRSAVYDVSAGTFLFQGRAYERVYPGSTTKLITALVAVKYCSTDTVMTVGGELGLLEGLASRCNIAAGEKFTLENLLYGMLLPSGCDAAYTIAVNVARKVSGNPNMGSRDAANYFTGLMNSYLKSIGANSSHMVNPHGYPYDSHYTTAYDMTLVARKIFEHPLLSKITSTPSKYVTAITGRGRTWTTTNSLINPNSGYYYRYARGMKTGTVNDNYTNVMSAVDKNGRKIITVVFGCESFNARYDATWKLYNTYLASN